MKILNLFRRDYVEWEDYVKLLELRNQVLFLHKKASDQMKKGGD
mgnify:CR=1 FL=1